MSQDIRNVEPKALWNYFADINAIPRPSKKEEKIIQFMMDFGKSLGLQTQKDAIGNIVIKKPASKGFETKQTVILQAHLDMVHQKNAQTIFDFEKQGIEMEIDGDWVKAKGTTLGADNGLGVAAIMGILASKEILHPAIEALFTIDEETGMTGAKQLDASLLSATLLLNLDTEEDDEIGIGCAGGIDVTATKTYHQEKVDTQKTALELKISGLQGGHSGMDIHKYLGNANKLMNRLLFMLASKMDFQLSSLQGGSLRNAIPRESNCTIVLSKNDIDAAIAFLKFEFESIFKEYQPKESKLKFEVYKIETPSFVMPKNEQTIFLKTIAALHNGVYKMSSSVENLVETSNNIAKIQVANGKITIDCLTRSSLESGKLDLVNTLTASFTLGGFEISLAGDYPGWIPNIEAPILKIVHNCYTKLFNAQPKVAACHAGLECGILGKHLPNVDMISFGPNIRGAHSPDERAQISSTQKFWKLLLEVLKNIPEKVK